MLLYHWLPVASIVFYTSTKFISLIVMMRRTLSSIPEHTEADEDSIKWVPKKKHEVLKAKYKCLKKLFQIYDAGIVGVPEPVEDYEDDTRTKRRRKRSHRTRTDAYACTSEIFVDPPKSASVMCECDKKSDIDILKQVKENKSCSTQRSDPVDDVLNENALATSKFEKYDLNASESLKEMPNLNSNFVQKPSYHLNRKPTRFQCFVQRLFGIRRDCFMLMNEGTASSDCVRERQRRKGLRFRRIRRAKKIKSEGDLNSIQRPAILSFVQSVQRSCLMDTTPRHCPILGCKMISYGIINYNDHLNLCHLKDKRYTCLYCHEGFHREQEKASHENEHLGLNKINFKTAAVTNNSSSNTQTDPDLMADEKIKKIVSFFDRITTDVAPDKAPSSETHLSNDYCEADSKHTRSCADLQKSHCDSTTSSRDSHPYGSPLACHYCGESFNFSKQLDLHINLEHRVAKFTKYHSCMGIVRTPSPAPSAGAPPEGRRCLETPRRSLISDDGRLNVLSMQSSRVPQRPFSDTASVARTPSSVTIALTKSEDSIGCDPLSIVYDTSRKSSLANSLMKIVQPYKWEPGTKVIRV